MALHVLDFFGPFGLEVQIDANKSLQMYYLISQELCAGNRSPLKPSTHTKFNPFCQTHCSHWFVDRGKTSFSGHTLSVCPRAFSQVPRPTCFWKWVRAPVFVYTMVILTTYVSAGGRFFSSPCSPHFYRTQYHACWHLDDRPNPTHKESTKATVAFLYPPSDWSKILAGATRSRWSGG